MSDGNTGGADSSLNIWAGAGQPSAVFTAGLASSSLVMAVGVLTLSGIIFQASIRHLLCAHDKLCTGLDRCCDTCSNRKARLLSLKRSHNYLREISNFKRSHIPKVSKEGKEAGWEPCFPLGKRQVKNKSTLPGGLLWIQMPMMPQDQSGGGSMPGRAEELRQSSE